MTDAARLSLRTLALLAVPAVAIGAGSALVLWLLDLAAEALHVVLWEQAPALFGATASTPWWILLMLTTIGLLVGAVVQFLPGHGGPDSATAELDAPPPALRTVPTIALAVLLGLAGGVSLGPENPIIAINSALAVALLARWAKIVPPALIGMLAVAGTIGALFGTPVAAALVFTGIAGGLKMGGSLWDRLFLPLTAGAAGAVTTHLLGGQAIAFQLEPMGALEPSFLVLGVLVAVVAALVGILAAWLLPILHRAFHALRYPIIFTTLGGLILGILGMIGGPETLFKGLTETGDLLTHPDDYSAGQLALFAGIKLMALLVAAAAGFRGGRIFPAVFIGTALGLLAYALLPGIPISLAVACAVLGILLSATKDGWIAIFVAIALVGDLAVLPLLCLIVLPVWLLVTHAPELVVRPAPAQAAPDSLAP